MHYAYVYYIYIWYTSYALHIIIYIIILYIYLIYTYIYIYILYTYVCIYKECTWIFTCTSTCMCGNIMIGSFMSLAPSHSRWLLCLWHCDVRLFLNRICIKIYQDGENYPRSHRYPHANSSNGLQGLKVPLVKRKTCMFIQCGAPKIAKLVTTKTRLCGSYNYS